MRLVSEGWSLRKAGVLFCELEAMRCQKLMATRGS